MSMEVRCVLDARAELGEGTVWDPHRAVLWWIDIWGKLIHQYDPATGEIENKRTFIEMTETGGPDLDVLYVTMAVLRRPAAHFGSQLNPGGLFAIQTGVMGLSSPAFKG